MTNESEVPDSKPCEIPSPPSRGMILATTIALLTLIIAALVNAISSGIGTGELTRIIERF